MYYILAPCKCVKILVDTSGLSKYLQSFQLSFGSESESKHSLIRINWACRSVEICGDRWPGSPLKISIKYCSLLRAGYRVPTNIPKSKFAGTLQKSRPAFSGHLESKLAGLVTTLIKEEERRKTKIWEVGALIQCSNCPSSTEDYHGKTPPSTEWFQRQCHILVPRA